MMCCFFFFFSSRRRHTRWTGDWSSDVCSSDLFEIRSELAPVRIPPTEFPVSPMDEAFAVHDGTRDQIPSEEPRPVGVDALPRSEERRVGKECRSRWGQEHYRKKERKVMIDEEY